jgi:hypothetical protein
MLPEELPTRALVEHALPASVVASLVLGGAAGAGGIREVRDIQGLLIGCRSDRDA